ncbi:hypothetical protein JTE90_009071 [Oedothorax gibbosus]|uniref:Short-chain dehydrogenase n=1 Tax=Oedothorax gibbosus TaxID=931172 RepID=A0AAV6V064_9ARAC|nr:hypothetical protein JTE90_009071 [Oedothorax gibbosus]
MSYFNAVARGSMKTVRFCSTLRDIVLLFGKILLTLLTSTFKELIVKRKKSLKDEVVLVTGAGKGLGKELALKFASEEAILVLWDIDEVKVQNVASDIRELGGCAHAYVCDVSDISKVHEVGARVLEEVGEVSIVVNNAGILQNVLFTDLDTNKIRKTLEVNLLSHFWVSKV